LDDWDSIPKIWPHLEILRIPQSKGLTMTKVLDLVSQLDVLKTIYLPEKMRRIPVGTKSCYASTTSSPIQFEDRFGISRCPFLPVEEISYDNDSNFSFHSDDSEEASLFLSLAYGDKIPDYYDDDNGDKEKRELGGDDTNEDPDYYRDNDRLSYGSDPGAWEAY